MLEGIQSRIAAHLAARNISRDDEIHLYVISWIAMVFCLATHVYLLLAYLVNGLFLFVAINLISIGVYSTLFFLHPKRKYNQIALAISIDVTIYTTIHLFLAGFATHIVGYYLLVCILQVILPYGTRKMRQCVLCGCLLTGAVALYYCSTHSPFVVFSDSLNSLLTVSNIIILFAGTLVQLYIGDVIKRIIERLNEIRMDELSTLAHTDPLTGLYNRRFADDYLNQLACSRQNPHCVAMLDIDDFKHVNDTWGHGCGDEVLVALAEVITRSLRKTDLAFRWGGEEILLVLDNVELKEAYAILEKLRQKIGATVFCAGRQNVRITVTIGVATLDPANPQDSIANSDRRLYRGKQGTKNVVIMPNAI